MARDAASPLVATVDALAAGLDPARLGRLREHLQSRYLDPGKLAGCQVLVWRRGQVALFESLGSMALGGDRPMRDDAIWRIFSMTKPITSVALMTLYERGHFQLNDPVERYIPSWRGLKVYGQGEPKRPMTVRDLLMHTAGLTSGMNADNPVGQLYREAGLPSRDYSLEEMARRLSDIPLLFEPGTRWHYSLATDVCGYLVEVLSGRPFDEYLRQELFEPLQMVDTDFSVPAPDVDRVPLNYRRTEDKSIEPIESRNLAQPPTLKSGAGGLLSTTADYLRFCRMLQGGGTLDGARILGPKTVELMRQNHLPGGVDLGTMALGTFGETQFAGVGFGLGFAVSQGPVPSGVIGSPGEYYWGGAASTIFWIDPVEDLIVIFMTQLMPSGTFNFRGQLHALVYPAIVS
jgi:CubicO group peptidase (beta-lactamase class C family)